MKKSSKFTLLNNQQLPLIGLVLFLILILFILTENKEGKNTRIPEKEERKKLFGVTMAGGEFGEKSLPGVMNRDYIYPSDKEEFGFFAENGLSVIRLPIRWERIQDKKFGELRKDDIKRIKQSVATAAQNKQKVIIDLHNFGRYFDVPLTVSDASAFADVWTKIAQEFKDDTTILGYELMNEPHDLPDGVKGWQLLAQDAVNAIRNVDKDHIILIPGYDWQSASRWRKSNEALSIADPENNIVFAAHEYFDSDFSGKYEKSYDSDRAYPEIGVDRLKPFQAWLKEHKQRGMLTEYGVPDHDEKWLVVLDTFMKELSRDENIIGGIYWSAGPWYGDYPLSVDPLKSKDSPQMRILSQYKSDT